MLLPTIPGLDPEFRCLGFEPAAPSGGIRTGSIHQDFVGTGQAQFRQLGVTGGSFQPHPEFRQITRPPRFEHSRIQVRRPTVERAEPLSGGVGTHHRVGTVDIVPRDGWSLPDEIRPRNLFLNFIVRPGLKSVASDKFTPGLPAPIPPTQGVNGDPPHPGSKPGAQQKLLGLDSDRIQPEGLTQPRQAITPSRPRGGIPEARKGGEFLAGVAVKGGGSPSLEWLRTRRLRLKAADDFLPGRQSVGGENTDGFGIPHFQNAGAGLPHQEIRGREVQIRRVTDQPQGCQTRFFDRRLPGFRSDELPTRRFRPRWLPKPKDPAQTRLTRLHLLGSRQGLPDTGRNFARKCGVAGESAAERDREIQVGSEERLIAGKLDHFQTKRATGLHGLSQMNSHGPLGPLERGLCGGRCDSS